MVEFLLLVPKVTYSQDEDAISCGDGLDNDFDGLVDLDDDECLLSTNPACYECPDGISFADEVLDYQSGCSESDDYPEGALGVCDWNSTDTDNPEMVFLGNEGWIRLEFNNNHLMNSGDAEPDLRVLQAGQELDFVISLRAFNENTENQLIANGFVSPNNDGFYTITTIGSLSSDLDIDEFLPDFSFGELKFNAVEIKDAGNGCDLVDGVSGVRIDAVCAMTSQFYSPPFECEDIGYLIQGNPVGIYGVDLVNGTVTLLNDDIFVASGFNPPLSQANAYGYNVLDNKIWGWWQSESALIRISANLKVDSVVYFPEIPFGVYGSGDINNDGVYSLLSQSGNSIYHIDLNPVSPNYLTMFSNPSTTPGGIIDWSYSPIDGKLYSVNHDVELVCYEIDGTFQNLGSVIGGGIEETNSFGAAFMDGFGSLYVQSNSSGEIFRIDNPHLEMTVAELIISGPISNNNDGLRCNLNLPYDCNQVVGGTAIFDDCGVCLEENDPEFNQSCLDCNGDFFGSAVLDECGVCLELDDSAFNLSCLDCNGVPNGGWLIDECGECLDSESQDFNQSCADCAGVPNGLSILDECGVCMLPNDPNFNLSCTDCAGIVNGSSEIDQCGECHEPSSPEFNQSCSDCSGIPNGLSIIDECGECYEPASPLFNSSCTDCSGEVNGLFVLDECGECLLTSNPLFNQSCADCAGVPNGVSAIDLCGECWPLESEFYNNCVDCNGTVFGDWFLNACNICVSPEELDPDLICYGDLVFVPNSFTPDNDGVNDVFYPTFAVPPREFELIIYNRWGEPIFQTNDYLTPWIGNVKNQEHFAVNGVYAYTLLYSVNDLSDRQILKGHLSLIR